MVLPTSAGHHRLAWDLRYPAPQTLNYGYTGTLLDYREYTLNWHALPGQTPRATLVGPMVLPGTYRATLTVNGQHDTQPISVVPDPRVGVPAAALAAQFALQQRTVAGITATYQALTYIHQVRDALAARTAAATSSGRVGDVTTAARALEEALAALADGPEGLGLAHRDLGRRLSDLLVGDVQPNASVVAGIDGPCRATDRAFEGLRQLQTTRVAELNVTLARLSLATLPVWTPPVGPACGGR